MSVHLERCSNPRCRRLYELEHCSRCFASPSMTAGLIICPHCGATVAGDPALAYSARALPQAFEHWPDEDLPKVWRYKSGTTTVFRMPWQIELGRP
jgi:hypothetical protein